MSELTHSHASALPIHPRAGMVRPMDRRRSDITLNIINTPLTQFDGMVIGNNSGDICGAFNQGNGYRDMPRLPNKMYLSAPSLMRGSESIELRYTEHPNEAGLRYLMYEDYKNDYVEDLRVGARRVIRNLLEVADGLGATRIAVATPAVHVDAIPSLDPDFDVKETRAVVFGVRDFLARKRLRTSIEFITIVGDEFSDINGDLSRFRMPGWNPIHRIRK